MTAPKEGRGGGPGPGPGPGSEPRGGHHGSGSAGDGYHGAANYTPHWTTRAFDTAKLFSLQLVTIGGSGALAKTAVAPLERVKILMQVQSMTKGHQYRGAWQALRGIGQREGYWAYYRGNGTNVARLFPEVTLKFVLHDQIKLMFNAETKSPSLRDRLAIGATTGLVRTAVVYPLELARTRISADTTAVGARKLYHGSADCLMRTFRNEGAAGLYKGVLISAAGVIPYLTISFAAYEDLKDRLPDSKDFKCSLWNPLAKMSIGAAASILAQTVTFPIDTVRRRMQMSGAPGTSTAYSGYWNCVSSMAAREGVAAFYRGALVNAVKTVPGAAMQFVAYDFIKTSLLVMETSTGGGL